MAIKKVYEIDFPCGHTEDRDLSDKPAGKRAGLAAWLAENGSCSACFRSKPRPDSPEWIAAKAAEDEARQARADAFGLPPLIGSEKQIPYGFKVRDLLIGAVYEHVEAGSISEDEFAATIIQPALVVDKASWWIDKKDAEADDLAELLADSGIGDAGASTDNPF